MFFEDTAYFGGCMKELEERIQEFAQKAGLSSKELSTIRANKTAVELYMTFHKSTLSED